MYRGSTSEGVGVVTKKPQHYCIRRIHHRCLTLLIVVVLCVDYAKSDPATPQVISTVSMDASRHPIDSECSKPKESQVGKAEGFVTEVTGRGQENDGDDHDATVRNRKDEQLNQDSNTRHDKRPEDLSTNITQEYEDATESQARKKSTEHPSHHDDASTSLPQNTEDYAHPHKSTEHPSHHENNLTRLPHKAENSTKPEITETFIEGRNAEVSRNFSSLSFSSLDSALLSLAFLTFAVFLVSLVQDLLNGPSSTTTSGRNSQTKKTGLLKLLSLENDDNDDQLADLIVLTLSSIDTLSYGRESPDCGRKFLCHLNRSGWHDGILGTASNYLVSLVFSLVSPSGFQDNLDAAKFGRERQDCTSRYASCPSVIGELLPNL